MAISFYQEVILGLGVRKRSDDVLTYMLQVQIHVRMQQVGQSALIFKKRGDPRMTEWALSKLALAASGGLLGLNLWVTDLNDKIDTR